MKLLKKIVDALDKIKVIIKFAKAIDASIDAFKAVLETQKDEAEN